MLNATPVGVATRVSCLSRLVDDNIIVEGREGVRSQASHPDNALPPAVALPNLFVPEKRATFSAAPVPTLPTVFSGPMGMGPGAAMASMGGEACHILLATS